ncbi:hypothetical protein QCA50_003501 [Cerrena zonata]|uniref:Scd6-like Sm domain-containing protein n=1 Tax=Cerrena zonata TaxID=2478898 RepID=A0AAW0GV39_9APHY
MVVVLPTLSLESTRRVYRRGDEAWENEEQVSLLGACETTASSSLSPTSTMALSFIGKPISLVSQSDVRYRGILAGIDPVQSTIQLSNVFSMGTETRRPPNEFIPPVQEPYQYIIFRASEVKDLAVDENPPAPRRSVHDDPAVLGASAPMPQGNFGYPPGQPSPQPAAQQAQQQRQGFPQQPVPPQAGRPQPAGAPAQGGLAPAAGPSAIKNGRPGPVTSANASLESVERAIGDLRVGNGADGTHHQGRGGRRGGRPHDNKGVHIPIPTTDFDFQSSNAKFDKAAIAPRKTPSNEAAEGADVEKDKGKEVDDKAYDPKKSFFDSLSSGSNAPTIEGRGRGGRRGGGGRNRREEERERNVATFGEPGGIGLMGPGAYVGGWGGYGRRGGGRGRRGTGAPAVGAR